MDNVVVGFIGPNGAGKTTTMKCLCNLVILDSGKIQICGIDLDQLKPPGEGEEVIVMTTDIGTIKIRLLPNAEPKAVENFIGLVKEGYYDGQSFYRIKKDYFIQSGDPTGEGKYGDSIWGEEFEDEFNLNYRHFYGALSMANSGPNTNDSNFFIVQRDEIDDDILELMEEIGEENGYTDEVIKAYERLGGVVVFMTWIINILFLDKYLRAWMW